MPTFEISTIPVHAKIAFIAALVLGGFVLFQWGELNGLKKYIQ